MITKLRRYRRYDSATKLGWHLKNTKTPPILGPITNWNIPGNLLFTTHTWRNKFLSRMGWPWLKQKLYWLWYWRYRKSKSWSNPKGQLGKYGDYLDHKAERTCVPKFYPITNDPDSNFWVRQERLQHWTPGLAAWMDPSKPEAENREIAKKYWEEHK